MCIKKDRAWQSQGKMRRGKYSPVEVRHAIPFFYPRPAEGLKRIKGCPRGYVYGCPAKGTKPKSQELPILQEYLVYFEQGFTWKQFLDEPEYIRSAVITMKGSIARREMRKLKAAQSEVDGFKASARDDAPQRPRAKRPPIGRGKK